MSRLTTTTEKGEKKKKKKSPPNTTTGNMTSVYTKLQRSHVSIHIFYLLLFVSPFTFIFILHAILRFAFTSHHSLANVKDGEHDKFVYAKIMDFGRYTQAIRKQFYWCWLHLQPFFLCYFISWAVAGLLIPLEKWTKGKWADANRLQDTQNSHWNMRRKAKT